MRTCLKIGSYFLAVFVATPLLFAGCSSEPDTVSITIDTVPESGALVKLDGEPVGMTPLTIEDVSAGDHYFVFTKAGYTRHNLHLPVEAGKPLDFKVELEFKTANISFETTPPGASVFLNDEYAGVTPLKNIEVVAGEHEYKIELKDHFEIEESTEVEAENFYSFTHALKAIQGTLQVFSRPSGAKVFINDSPQKESTPAVFNLNPGIYTLGIHQKGYMLKEETVEISANTQHKLETVLEKGNMPLGMVLVPEGEFTFGLDNGPPDERPQKKISLKSFYIDKFEVSNAQFKEVFPDHIFAAPKADFPVTGVTWHQAAEYAAAVNKRLPTEQEWEKAARGSKGNLYPWGNAFDPKFANIEKGLGTQLSKVGQFRKGVSIYGAMDMSGNALEWTHDWYRIYDGNNDVTIEYGNIYRVLRGGSYMTDAFDSRSTKRHFAKPDEAKEDYGFRCVMDAL